MGSVFVQGGDALAAIERDATARTQLPQHYVAAEDYVIGCEWYSVVPEHIFLQVEGTRPFHPAIP